MKIAFLGNFVPPFSTENDLAWSFRDAGIEVITMQEDQWTTDDILERCIAQECKLLLYVHTHGWETPGSFDLDQLWQDLKDRGIKTASFHLDYWRGLDREKDVGNHPFWRTEYVFTADGGSHEWYREQGINHYWLPPGVVKRDCYWAQPLDRFQHDVIFVGSKEYHKEWDYRPKLIDWLQQVYGERFALYGKDGLQTVRGPELNQLYRSAKVVVGDSLCLGFKHPKYWSDRVPETLGRGGFLIHPYIAGMEKYFKDGRHLAYYQYGNFEQLKNQIDYYLRNYLKRERIRLRGHSKVKQSETYTNRVQQMLKVMELNND